MRQRIILTIGILMALAGCLSGGSYDEKVGVQESIQTVETYKYNQTVESSLNSENLERTMVKWGAVDTRNQRMKYHETRFHGVENTTRMYRLMNGVLYKNTAGTLDTRLPENRPGWERNRSEGAFQNRWDSGHELGRIQSIVESSIKNDENYSTSTGQETVNGQEYEYLQLETQDSSEVIKIARASFEQDNVDVNEASATVKIYTDSETNQVARSSIEYMFTSVSQNNKFTVEERVVTIFKGYGDSISVNRP